MSPNLATGIGFLICLQLLFQHIISTSSGCDYSYQSLPPDCVDAYETALGHAYSTGTTHADHDIVTEFRKDINDLPNDEQVPWCYHWAQLEHEPKFIDYCKAVKPIDSSLSTTPCLCQLQFSCDDICDDQIATMFFNEVDYFPSAIGKGEIPNEQQQCQTVFTMIQNRQYDKLCGDVQDLIDIKNCANGTPSPGTIPTPNPTKKVTPSPTTPAPTQATPKPTDAKPVQGGDSPADNTPNTPAPTTPTPTTATPTDAPSFTPEPSQGGAQEGGQPSDQQTPAPIDDTPLSTLQSTPAPNVIIDLEGQDDLNGTDSGEKMPWEEPTHQPTLYNPNRTLDTQDTPSTTSELSALPPPTTGAHAVANLVLVALIIIGFCVFVAWYAKKNQIATDGNNKGDEDNGYLWGLNQQSSPSSEQRMGIDDRGHRDNQKSRRHKGGRSRHKPLSQFDEDQLDQQMNIQMTMTNNNDLLAITPDHVGRLQTRAPNQMAPNAPNQTQGRRSKRDRKRDRKTRRRGKGAAFEQVKDDEDPCPDEDDSESDDSESGEDMMKMRDQYYASQTFGKKLADTLGDIKDTGTAIAQAVQSKLIKKAPTVVRPMQMGPGPTKEKKSKKKKDNKRQPFTMVDDNETTDGFDLSDSSSNSTKEDEYREDPETEVRMNIHGRKIKQPMKLPTFDDDDDEEVDLTASHNDDNTKKSKKKRKKDKKKKKKKEKKRKETTTTTTTATTATARNATNTI